MAGCQAAPGKQEPQCQGGKQDPCPPIRAARLVFIGNPVMQPGDPGLQFGKLMPVLPARQRTFQLGIGKAAGIHARMNRHPLRPPTAKPQAEAGD